MQRYVVTTAPKAWRDWIITIIISERENKACCLAWHYRAIILTPVKLRTSVIKVHACVLEHWLCQCRELDVQRRKGATSSHAHAHAHAKRDNPVVPFFFQRSFFCGYFHTICQTACETQRSHAESLTTEALCKPRPTLPTYAPPKCNSNADTRSTGWRHYVLPPPPSTRSVPLELFHFPWQISPWAIHQRHKPILKAQDDFVTTAATLLCHAASFSFTNKPKYSLHIPALSACNFCIAGTTCSSQPSSSKTLGHLICVCEAMTSITCCPVCCTTLH